MTSVAAESTAHMASPDDVLHLLFNQADGILACQQSAPSKGSDLFSEPALSDALPDLGQQSQPSPPDSQGSGGSGSCFASFTGGSSLAGGGSGDDLLHFDLDSFLSGAEALDHASYELGPPADSASHSPGPLRGGSGANGGGTVAGGSSGKRRKRQLAQLPYSIGDLEDDDLALYGGGGGGGGGGSGSIWDEGDDDDGGFEGGGKPEGLPGEPLLLTAEEQRVVRQLGAVLPSHFPLTREETRILRTVRRKIRNKISAKNSRAKKQEYIRGLELRVKGTTAENGALRDRCAGLEQQNRRLLGAVRRLQAFVRCSGLSLTSTAGKATGTGLFILCLSFALFLTPQLGPLLAAGPGTGGDASMAAGPRPATGRRILAASHDETAAAVAEKSGAIATGGAAVDGLRPADSQAPTDAGPAPAAANQSMSSAAAAASVADAAADEDGSVASSASPPVSPAASQHSPASYYYYYSGGGVGGGDDDAPPREQDLADRDL